MHGMEIMELLFGKMNIIMNLFLIIFLDTNNETIKEVVVKKDKTEFLTILNEVLNRINT